MTPAARVQAAIELIDAWQSGAQPLDRLLTAWGRKNRYAGSGDRRAIADLVHDALRCKRSAAWTAGADEKASGRQILHGLLLLQGRDADAMFSGDRHAPEALTTREIEARRSLATAPQGVRCDCPEWLLQQVTDLPLAAFTAQQARALLDLRVNLLAAGMESAVEALSRDGIIAHRIKEMPTALRVTKGQRHVMNSAAYRTGMVEIQDAASQRIATLCAARPGETVLDLCAGGGGKTLAMAADMENKGRLIAHDIAPERMRGLPERARRAGADIEIIGTSELTQLQRLCDLVLVDAPCSGSGTWRRNPDAKWHLTVERLAELTSIQDDLLAQAEALTAPGGRIVYATCSILSVENQDRVDQFVAASRSRSLRLSEHLLPGNPGDGMFGAVVE